MTRPKSIYNLPSHFCPPLGICIVFNLSLRLLSSFVFGFAFVCSLPLAFGCTLVACGRPHVTIEVVASRLDCPLAVSLWSIERPGPPDQTCTRARWVAGACALALFVVLFFAHACTSTLACSLWPPPSPSLPPFYSPSPSSFRSLSLAFSFSFPSPFMTFFLSTSLPAAGRLLTRPDFQVRSKAQLVQWPCFLSFSEVVPHVRAHFFSVCVCVCARVCACVCVCRCIYLPSRPSC